MAKELKRKMRRFIGLQRSIEFKCKGISSCKSSGAKITDRQENVPGFNQEVMNNLSVVLIGAGGLGGEIAEGLVRKGVGKLMIFDGDTVELSNLSRQKFYKKDLYKNKAVCLGRNMVKQAIHKTEIIAHPCMFQRAVEKHIDTSCDIAICAPDNNATRVYVSKHYHNTIPVIFLGLDEHANTGYVFIQEPGKQDFLDIFPDADKNTRTPCPNTPAIIDILKTIAGFVLFAIDSVTMDRKRNWNFRQFYMCGFVQEIIRKI